MGRMFNNANTRDMYNNGQKKAKHSLDMYGLPMYRMRNVAILNSTPAAEISRRCHAGLSSIYGEEADVSTSPALTVLL